MENDGATIVGVSARAMTTWSLAMSSRSIFRWNLVRFGFARRGRLKRGLELSTEVAKTDIDKRGGITDHLGGQGMAFFWLGGRK